MDEYVCDAHQGKGLHRRKQAIVLHQLLHYVNIIAQLDFFLIITCAHLGFKC